MVLGTAQKRGWRDFRGLVARAYINDAILDRDLKIHPALCQRSQLLALFGRNLPDGEIARAGKL